MPDKIGPHLLGRRPSPPDPRDWRISDLSKRLKDKTSGITIKRKASFWEAIWEWILNLIGVIPSPIPPVPVPPVPPTPPIPPPTSRVWNDPIQLDQGQTPHCVGFGWAAWADSDPIDETYQNADGDAIYYECKIIDGEPGMEDGSNVRSGAKALQVRKRLSAYAFASTTAEVKQWLLTNGTVVMGSDWFNSMFNPTADGFVTPTGTVAGGHCYICLGYDSSSDSFLFQNSWGASWGLKGRFKMKASDVDSLIFVSGTGEACVAVELPL
jgi:hypothetical protein